MTTQKDFKRLVRARMQKTGESYTAARSRLLVRPRPIEPAVNYGKLAGKSDATIKAKTGCDWKRWVNALDYAGAITWPHRQIVQYVVDKFDIDGWWAQTVTVGYERIKGRRAIGQRVDGSYEATKSKVFAVPLTRVYRAFVDTRTRRRWLTDVDPSMRTASPRKYVRMQWPDQTSVVVGFTKMPSGKTQVAVQHAKLPDKATATRWKTYWGERLGALAELLA